MVALEDGVLVSARFFPVDGRDLDKNESRGPSCKVFFMVTSMPQLGLKSIAKSNRSGIIIHTYEDQCMAFRCMHN